MIDEDLNLPNKVEDIYGNVIYLEGSPIGQGGQGVVCRTKDKNIAVKFLINKDKIVEDDQLYEVYKNRINDISILKIDDDINICRPEIMLKQPICGYVMKLLNNLSPASELLYSEDKGDVKDYLRTDGNLRKKVEVLIELSRILARIHSKGMIYGDLSPNNVFYSKEDVFSKVWLIDCDNLHLYDEAIKSIYTPGYGAPEVVKDLAPNSQYSDSFSFAVLAFKLLTSTHPFINDYNDQNSSSGGWDATTVASASNADANDVVWVCSKESNAPDELIQYISHFVPANLMKLFEATFNETGRKLPYTRPSMRTWFENLCQIYTKIWKCSCGNYNYYYDKQCVACDNNQITDSYCSLYSICGKSIHDEVVNKFKSNYEINEDDFVDDHGIVKDKDIIIYNGLTLYNFDFENACIYDTPYPYIAFKFYNDALVVSNIGNIECKYHKSTGEEGSLNNDIKIQKGEQLFLNFYKDRIVFKQLCIWHNGLYQ